MNYKYQILVDCQTGITKYYQEDENGVVIEVDSIPTPPTETSLPALPNPEI